MYMLYTCTYVVYTGSCSSTSEQQWALPPPLQFNGLPPPPQLYCPNFCLLKHYCPSIIRLIKSKMLTVGDNEVRSKFWKMKGTNGLS